MFELISGEHRQVPHGDTVPMLISSGIHLIVLGTIVAIPLLYVSSQLPEVPDMLAFVATAAPPPPPPPPPPPGGAKSAVAKPVPTSGPDAAPVEAPTDILPESEVDFGAEGGVPGGVEGGVPGGVLGGIVGGLPSDIPPPPPPPPPAPVERGPIRTGGELQAPALVRRVAPVYPELAVKAQVHGVVILEAIVDREGRVESVKVLRSIPVLDDAAVNAVRQWQYSPLLLNGKPERFIVTVTVSFSIKT